MEQTIALSVVGIIVAAAGLYALFIWRWQSRK